MNASPLEVTVLRGLDGYMAVVIANGEWVGFYPAETEVAATSQAALAAASGFDDSAV